ncbi:MAG: hypothetical protein H5T99_01640, partial [Moorella sp. (in: Bacteria)]|nr:hypothetical protein [Moorella sp. (in: firmicutes)]
DCASGGATAPARPENITGGSGLLGGNQPASSDRLSGSGQPRPTDADAVATTGEPPQDQSPACNQPLTLAAHSQALFREAVLNGSVNHLLADLRVWIEKIRTFLLYADTGIETVDNIVSIAKSTLEKELGLAGTAPAATPTQLPASSLQLMWNLMRTPEFQQFSGRMLAQMLKMSLTPPGKGESPG